MTRLPTDLLDRPPEEGARLLALAHLAEAEAAEKRMPDPNDHEALHDFRVSIRRLRSVCRAYRSELKTSVSERLRRSLREITVATNAGRDAEVLAAWVTREREALGSEGRAGADWIVARLQEQRAAGDGPLSSGTATAWHELAEGLHRRLSQFKTVMHVGRSGRRRPFSRVVGEQVAAEVVELRARLAAVSGRDDADEAHEARISAKRLRYLLEPLMRRGKTARAFVDRLKALQDLLGDLRDLQLLAGKITAEVGQAAAERARQMHRLALEGGVAFGDRPDEGTGLVELARLARERTTQLYGAFESEWLAGRAESFLQDVEKFAETFDARRSKRHVEIERKFLLSAIPERVRDETPAELAQGWIPGTDLHERIRRTRSASGDVFTRTLKFGNGIRRTEIEEATTGAIFESLWPLTEGRRVSKRRYDIKEGDLTWSVDEFTDRELVLAEVELPSVDTEAPIPGWLEPYVVREVTDESEFVNLNLAK